MLTAAIGMGSVEVEFKSVFDKIHLKETLNHTRKDRKQRYILGTVIF